MKVLLFLLLCGIAVAEAPKALYLSWIRNPDSSMTIHWHTSRKDKESVIYYQREGEAGWKRAEGSAVCVPKSSMLSHLVDLQDLESNTRYNFKIGQSRVIHKFRTCPKTLERPLRFAVGGDVYFYLYLLRKMNKQIAKTDPDFVVVGGDLAYTYGHKSLFKGRDWEEKRWGTFFREWSRDMVAPDGRLIPMVVIAGNHDMGAKQAVDPIFYALFAFEKPETPYRTLDFGEYFSLFLLDTGHTRPIEGEQALWLEKSLAERKTVPSKMAAYHVSAYPSVYAYTSGTPTKIRAEWVPLFERYGLQVAFEHHNHAYKRTHPIREGKVDASGVLYLGDGAWGVSPRKPYTPKELWYLAASAQKNCFWLVTLDRQGSQIQSLDNEGKVIESIEAAMMKSP